MTSVFLDLDNLRCSYGECRKEIHGGRMFLNRDEGQNLFTAYHEACLELHERDKHLQLLRRVVPKKQVRISPQKARCERLIRHRLNAQQVSWRAPSCSSG